MTAEPDAGWTMETLRVHLQSVIDGNDRRYEQRFHDQERAVTKAEVAAEKRLDSVNEFRATLSDQAGTLMPRSEAEVRLASLAARVVALESKVDQSAGRSAGLSQGWAVLVGFGTLAAAAIGIAVALR